MRVKVPAGKGNAFVLHEIKQSLAPVPGVRSVEVNPTTGTLIVHYDGSDPGDFHGLITRHGESSGLFALGPPELSEVDRLAETIEKEAEFLAAHSELARSVVDATKSFDNALKKATNNNLDLKVLLPLGLAVYAFLEVGAEIATPLWVTLGIFSFNSFIALHPPLSSISVETEKVVREEGKTTSERSVRRRRERS